MRTRVAVATLVLFAAVALNACGGSSTNSASSNPTIGANGTYNCAKGLEAVDLPLGEHVEKDGSSFQLTQKMEPYGGEQESATLKVKLSPHERLPAFIITPSYHHFVAEESPQTVVKAAVGRGGSATFTLLTTAYNAPYSVISSVTLCLNLSH